MVVYNRGTTDANDNHTNNEQGGHNEKQTDMDNHS